MRRIPVALLAGAVAVIVTGASSAAKVAWNEKAKHGKATIMNFHVDSLTFGVDSWSAHVTFDNVSKKTITIGDQFGAAIFADPKTEDPRREIGFAEALRFSPARPTELKPGASWTGTIGGDGHLNASRSVRWARVVFGPLRGLAGQSGAVWWVTDHALALPASGSSPPSGNVI